MSRIQALTKAIRAHHAKTGKRPNRLLTHPEDFYLLFDSLPPWEHYLVEDTPDGKYVLGLKLITSSDVHVGKWEVAYVHDA